MPTKLIAGSIFAAALAASAAFAPIYAAANRATADESPELTGVWVRTGEPSFEPIPGSKDGAPVGRQTIDHPDAAEIWAGDWTSPVLQPWAREIVKKNAESEIALKHVYQADDSCWPVTVPAILNMREAVSFLQTKDRVTIIYQRDHQVRRVWLNQSHTAGYKPSWYGESVGHFDGDTLIVDTVGIKTHSMSVVDQFGTPHTDKLHVVERYRPIEDARGKGLEVTIRVEDPGAFTQPWSGRFVYRPNRVQNLEEVACAENNRDFHEGETFGAIPEEKTLPF